MRDIFKLNENNTTKAREMLAGLTTFLAMAYILAVNPDILSASGMPKGGVFFATAIASFVGTAFMAFFANYPFALAPGMGLNAYFAYTVVLGMGYSWQFALLAVFVEQRGEHINGFLGTDDAQLVTVLNVHHLVADIVGSLHQIHQRMAAVTAFRELNQP